MTHGDFHGFDKINFYLVNLVDTFHMKRHTCNKAMRTRKDKTRLKGVNRSICEIFNAWLRPMNFFLNSFRPQSHKFWVEGACLFYNDVSKSLPRIMTRRSNPQSRKKTTSRKK